MTVVENGIRAGVCTGDGPCDPSPLGAGKNWVTKTDPMEGIGVYARAIAHALIRDKGFTESHAIATAIGAVKHWAAGGGNVTDATRARAAAEVAHWEALKAKSAARDASKGTRAGTGLRRGGLGVPQKCKYCPARATKATVWAEGAAYIPTCDNHLEAARSRVEDDNGDQVERIVDLPQTRGAPTPATDFGEPPDVGQPRITPRPFEQPYPTQDIGVDPDQPDNSPAYIIGIMDRRAGKAMMDSPTFRQAHPDEDGNYQLYKAGYLADRGDMTGPMTDDRASRALLRLRAVLNTGFRDMGSGLGSGVAEWGASGPPTVDASGSGNLLPVGPSKKVADDVDEGIAAHRFVGSDLTECAKCGKPVSAPVHKANKGGAGVRHSGAGHAPVQTGHIRGQTGRRARAAKAAHDRSAQSLEEPLTEAMERLFADQKTSTLARFGGKRGKQMLKRAGVRAAPPPSNNGAPTTTPAAPPPVGASGVVIPAQIGATLGSGVTTAALAAGTVTAAALAVALGVSVAALVATLGYASVEALEAALVAGRIRMVTLQAKYPRQTAGIGSPAPVAAQVTPAVPELNLDAIDPSGIFDVGYWNGKMSSTLRPYYDTAATQASSNVRNHLELPATFDDSSSLGAARAFLADRGNMTSPQINATTYDQIVKELQAGVAAGEGHSALAARIAKVFDQATATRARRIAQTEVQSALNGSANAYASALPSSMVASKRWLAHWPPTGGADPRTRDTHRGAAGQTVPVGSPFYVGGYPMQYPGDPAAPPDLTVNCRCALMFLPPGSTGDEMLTAAKTIAAANFTSDL